MSFPSPEPPLSIIIAVVGGKQSLYQCLSGLYYQAVEVGAELIVPFDKFTTDILQLSQEFPNVRFVDAGLTSPLAPKLSKISRHCNYDRRRAAGLGSAKGAIIALTEDHAIPAPDWCRQILVAHEEDRGACVIGGAIENNVNRPMNWAWYYTDFGRYGRPIDRKNVEYVSDVNVSYKRKAIMRVKDLWETGFHETTVHWALGVNGESLVLNPRLVVFQNRRTSSIVSALRERVEWGRAFAETRVCAVGKIRRWPFAVGSSILPFVLYSRAIRNMIRHERSFGFMLRISPLLFVFLIFWSLGEAAGYLNFPRRSDRSPSRSLDESVPIS